MYEFNRMLYLFSDLIKKSDLNKIIIKQKEVEFIVENPRITLIDDISTRCPVFEIINFKSYEPRINFFLNSVLKDGDIIFDIGAGTGWYALNFASVFKKSKIFAFEPIKDLFNILSVNAKKNKLSNVQPFNFGVSDQLRSLDFYYIKNQHEYLKNILKPFKIEVTVHSLGQLIKDLGLSEINFIKQELRVRERPFILGNEKMIERYLPMMMFSFREYWDKKLIKLFHQKASFLYNLGYKKITFDEDSNRGKIEEKHCFYFHVVRHSYVKNIKW